MSNISFKRGQQTNLNKLTNSDDGTLYLTTDTGRLYMGSPNSAPTMLYEKDFEGKQNKIWSMPTTAAELQSDIDAGKSIYINSHIYLQQPIIINRNFINIEFGDRGLIYIQPIIVNNEKRGFPAFIIGSQTKKVSKLHMNHVTITTTVFATEGILPGAIGLQIAGATYGTYINNLHIQGCECGIQTTGGFDCAQQISLYEPFLDNCTYGIEDSQGGLQNTRFFGGRIEGNKRYGVLTASPNLCFEGTMIQGNGGQRIEDEDGKLIKVIPLEKTAQVKFINTTYVWPQEGGYGTPGATSVMKSGGSFINCYFEQFLPDTFNPTWPIIQLGEEDPINGMDDGWQGSLAFIGCKARFDNMSFISCKGDIPQIKIDEDGDPTTPPDVPASAQKTIQITSCHFHGEQLFNLPNVTKTCIINVTSVIRGLASHANVATGVNKAARINYIDSSYSQTGILRADAIMGNNNQQGSSDIWWPLNYCYSKELRMEPVHYDSAGSLTNQVGQWIKITSSNKEPWNDTSVAGTSPGSLHYCTASRAWYQLTAWGSSNPDNWEKLSRTTYDAEETLTWIKF